MSCETDRLKDARTKEQAYSASQDPPCATPGPVFPYEGELLHSLLARRRKLETRYIEVGQQLEIIKSLIDVLSD